MAFPNSSGLFFVVHLTIDVMYTKRDSVLFHQILVVVFKHIVFRSRSQLTRRRNSSTVNRPPGGGVDRVLTHNQMSILYCTQVLVKFL